jgi:hypothetical protein
MIYIKMFENYLKDKQDVKFHIQHARIPEEYKEIALKLLKPYTRVKKSVIYELQLHPDLKKKIKEKNLPNGFSMGIDKAGFFIQTHRCRSKSHPSPDKITIKEIKFVDSTG